MKFTGQNFSIVVEKAPGPEELPFPLQVLRKNAQALLPEECVILHEEKSPENVVSQMTETGVWNTVQDEPELLRVRLHRSARLIQHPRLFFENPSKEVLIPIDLKNKSEESSERRWKFRSTAEKQYVMKMVERHVQNIPGAKGIAGTIVSIADELFTNALFNAPFGDLDSTLDRTTLVVLNPEMAAEIIVGHTADQIFLGCIDVFGSLDCENLLGRIYTGFKGGISDSVNMDSGGAGFGLLRMVDLAADIFVIVEKEKKTLVGCSFILKRGAKKIRQTAKSFYFQSFQNVEASAGSIRVERRGRHALFRVFGKLNEDFPFSQFELSDVEEISIDLRLVTQIRTESLLASLKLLQSVPSLKRIYLEYMPYEFLSESLSTSQLQELKVEVRSLYISFRCPACKNSKKIFYVKSNESLEKADQPKCPKCNYHETPTAMGPVLKT